LPARRLSRLVDTHAHWTEIRRGILDTQNWSFPCEPRVRCHAGLDVQTVPTTCFAYQDLVDSGDISRQRAFSTGPAFFPTTTSSLRGSERCASPSTENITALTTSRLVVASQAAPVYGASSKNWEMMPTTEGALDLKLNLTHVIDASTQRTHPPHRSLTRCNPDVCEIWIAETPTSL